MKKMLMAGVTMLALVSAVCAQPAREIRFGTEPGYKPFEYKNTTGQIEGFDIDLGEALCAQLKAKCVWVESTFDGMIPALKAKKFDAILSAMTINEKRLKEIAFSDRIYQVPAKLVVKTGSPLLPTAASLKGKRVGVQQGTTHEAFALKHWQPGGVEVVAYKSATDIYPDLANGRLDGAINTALVMTDTFLSTPEGKGFSFAGGDLRDAAIYGPGVGIGLRKEDDELRRNINSALIEVKKIGTYKKLAAKYFPYDISGD